MADIVIVNPDQSIVVKINAPANSLNIATPTTSGPSGPAGSSVSSGSSRTNGFSGISG